jgi:hypothetical protein
MIQLHFEIAKRTKQDQQKDHTLTCSISGLLNTTKCNQNINPVEY